MNAYRFTCGTCIYFVDENGNYLIEEPGHTFTFFGLSEDMGWKFVNIPRTYEEWLERKKVVDRSDYIGDMLKIVVMKSEGEYVEGMKYEEKPEETEIM